MKYSALDTRMKSYENVSRVYLTKRTPVIIRIDGKSFHTFTRGLDRPFDRILSNTMKFTALELCKSIQNARIAYTQSDEISIMMYDNTSIECQAFFENNLQKIASITASMATLYFNRIFQVECRESFERDLIEDVQYDYIQKKTIYFSKFDSALFDSRAFNIPESEVCNYFIWRQQDATRNSVQMLGRHYFSDKELHKLSGNKIQEKLFTEKGINWNDLETSFKRGSCVVKALLKDSIRASWLVDLDIPIFTSERAYIEDLLENSINTKWNENNS